MSDQERLTRLTELARRVWPDVEVERGYGDDAWLVSNESGVALSIDHPRALDALEAALLVLAVETPQYILGSGGLSGPEAYRLHLAFERGRKRILELEARVLELEQSLEAERVEGLER